MNSLTGADMLSAIKRICPQLKISSERSVLESHGQDWTRFRKPSPLAVAFPDSVEQVQQLVSVAAAGGLALVPSGGRTGLSGGAVADRGEVVVSFDRLRRILEFDPIDRTLTVQAGVITATVQEFAREKGLYYPVSFASEGSSQVGGNIATNAGGIRVLRHGLTRDRVKGLKVVTGRGEILDCNRGLVKNASGYDLRHLFIGSEGTLGLIVEATLQLVNPPPPGKVLLLGLQSLDALMPVFESFQSELSLSAFEFFTDKALQHVCLENEWPLPLATQCPLYVVVEFDCPDNVDVERALHCFESGLEAGWLLDGVISQNDRQTGELWRYRESISESITRFTPYKYDLAVRVSKVTAYLGDLKNLVARHCPEFEVIWYGHIGDGNLHMNILKPDTMDLPEFESKCEEISELIYALTEQYDGSISAEHGIGLLKRSWLHRTRSAAEIEMMHGIKSVFDPAGIFNPGKLL
jgi:FAD/FMN-containing dehydrogenase